MQRFFYCTFYHTISISKSSKDYITCVNIIRVILIVISIVTKIMTIISRISVSISWITILINLIVIIGIERCVICIQCCICISTSYIETRRTNCATISTKILLIYLLVVEPILLLIMLLTLEFGSCGAYHVLY